tara:strand:- start:2315 stop:3124 length:810 start_codon:yes stop_codon:yes gene_type:complete
MKCKICSGNLKIVASFNKKQLNENLFGLEKFKKFKRSIIKCKKCGHYSNQHNYSSFLNKVYEKDYSRLSYGKISKKFESVNQLPKQKSSNFHRCKFINSYKKFNENKKLLDIGAGFGIFVFLMKKMGWRVRALEVNHQLCNFISKKLQVRIIKSSILDNKFQKKEKYDLITLNKVLEHFNFINIKKILKKLKKILETNGKIYIEIPNGEAASKKGFHRQEFFLEHYNIFSPRSIKLLLEQLNYKIIKLQKLREITGKYAIRIIAQPNHD